jgi:hypothetical protein
VQSVATLDCLASLGNAARCNKYIKPVILKEGPRKLCIEEGRNPIVEQLRDYVRTFHFIFFFLLFLKLDFYLFLCFFLIFFFSGSE